MKWILASERLPDTEYRFSGDDFGTFPIRFKFEFAWVTNLGYLQDGQIWNAMELKPYPDNLSIEWLDETTPEATTPLPEGKAAMPVSADDEIENMATRKAIEQVNKMYAEQEELKVERQTFINYYIPAFIAGYKAHQGKQ